MVGPVQRYFAILVDPEGRRPSLNDRCLQHSVLGLNCNSRTTVKVVVYFCIDFR